MPYKQPTAVLRLATTFRAGMVRPNGMTLDSGGSVSINRLPRPITSAIFSQQSQVLVCGAVLALTVFGKSVAHGKMGSG